MRFSFEFCVLKLGGYRLRNSKITIPKTFLRKCDLKCKASNKRQWAVQSIFVRLDVSFYRYLKTPPTKHN